ncbi:MULTISPECIES: dTMP kinase [unclassified Candidatus Tisiphia]|jgi:dTMP kinase|uniref:dTMP kinase n=1 Tax=unclassified Candidatus Tisiphia TaxID=2996318 RepID=UPI001E7AC474|nr:MAG: dTMP kinase [Rickettsia endosymbiont of Cimex lectularius]
MSIKKGKFITFEGGEGCGKSTQSNMLYQYLLSQNIPVDLTREVGGTISAEKMRDILVNQDLLPMSELLQIMAARYEHIHKKIIPKLNSGISVICDRFVDSTACYQGQDIGIDLVYDLHKSLISDVMPDITFFIDIDPNIALPRALVRGNNNKFESKNIEFHQKVYDGFQYISAKFPNRIVKINASTLSVQEIHDIIVAMLVTKVW